jgi:hypothetical protein
MNQDGLEIYQVTVLPILFFVISLTLALYIAHDKGYLKRLWLRLRPARKPTTGLDRIHRVALIMRDGNGSKVHYQWALREMICAADPDFADRYASAFGQRFPAGRPPQFLEMSVTLEDLTETEYQKFNRAGNDGAS